MSDRFRARVSRSWRESSTLYGLALTVPRSALAAHRAPGQYVNIWHAGDDSQYALANEPGSAELELLIKPGKAMTDSMALLVPGDELEISAPTGKGFPLHQHEGWSLILCAAGSGVAPLRAVVRAVLPQRARFGAVHMVYGQRLPSEIAYRAEQETWKAQGVDVVTVVSGPPDVTADWTGPRGYVQDALRATHPDLHHAAAYLCGMGSMVSAVKSVLRELGMDPAHAFLNF